MAPEEYQASDTKRNQPNDKDPEPPGEVPRTGQLSKKERVINELKEVFCIVAYLEVSLCFVATIKSLVLIQQGTNDFLHGYLVVVPLALVLGKVVSLAQHLPVLNAFNKRPMIWSSIYKSVLMLVIVDLVNKLEEIVFHSGQSASIAIHPAIFLFAHQLTLVFIFLLLFIVRDLDKSLGHGKLTKLIIGPRQRPATVRQPPPVTIAFNDQGEQ